MALFRLTALTFLTAVFCLVQDAYAADAVTFIAKDAAQDSSPRSIIAAYDFSEIASTDLNQDGIDEFILKQKAEDEGFEFRVIAQNDTGDVELGLIKANKLMISYNRIHGIRSILAFNDANNDFDYDVYQWVPKKLSYVHSQSIEQGEAL